MQRRWAVRPEEGYITIDYEEGLRAVIDLYNHVWRSGGFGTFTGHRVKAEDVIADGLPGEAFTSLLVCEWKDRTDARPAPEQTIPVERPVVEPYEGPEAAFEGTNGDDDDQVLVNVSDPSEVTEEASVGSR